jgi:cobalamin biosynthesis Co2+ chelatase CbiK
MEEVVDIEFPHLNAKTKSLIVGAVYRQSLIEVGHSPDFHVYDLEKSLLEHKNDHAAGAFINKVHDFYFSLHGMERKVFLCECLEHGRHYTYWWLNYCNEKQFSRFLSSVANKASATF